MNALAIYVPVSMGILWSGLSMIFRNDALRATALVSANMWACTALVIGVLR